jgi:DNA-binding transcriptional MerR regulator
MDDEGPLLTIGELANRAGVSVRTIRFWSDTGLVPPAARTTMPVWVPGRPRRLKDAEDVARLRQALESEKAQPSQVCP